MMRWAGSQNFDKQLFIRTAKPGRAEPKASGAGPGTPPKAPRSYHLDDGITVVPGMSRLHS